MSDFEILYTAVGGLGLFFLGLKLLSDALQSSGGDIIRNILATASGNRVMALLAGLGITAFVQSSSISTVMTVGLVNAGVLELKHSLAVILGSNIGATISGWILALDLGRYGLLLIAIGALPMLAGNSNGTVAAGKALLALGLLFTSLDFMRVAFEPLRLDQGFLAYMHLIDAETIGTLLACVILGVLLTMLIRNSTAMLAITLTLAATGVIEFNTSIGLIVGMNLGAALIAQMAASEASTSALRVARANVLFNVLGALLAIVLFPLFIDVVDALVAGDPDMQLASGERPNIAWHIAIAHTLFNLIVALVWMPLLDYLTKLLEWLIPQQVDAEVHRVKYLNQHATLAPEVALQQADLELDNLIEITRQMFNLTRTYATGEKADKECFDRISEFEDVTDSIEEEMITFITKILASSVTQAQSSRAYGLIRMADELESIADCLESFCIYRTRLYKQRETLSADAWNDLMSYFNDVDSFVGRVVGARRKRADSTRITHLMEEGKRLNRVANAMRDRHLERLKDGTCMALPAQTYSDMFVSMRRIKNHAINILETYAN
jgi:phosphate:Na+ symporter